MEKNKLFETRIITLLMLVLYIVLKFVMDRLFFCCGIRKFINLKNVSTQNLNLKNYR